MLTKLGPLLRNVALLTALGPFVVGIGCHSETDGGTKTAGVSSDDDLLTGSYGMTLADELWKVGRLDGPEHEALGRIGGVTFVGDGLAVSDSHTNRIHWYDRSGQHVISAGGSGGGPGEFEAIHSLGVLPDGTVAALDLAGSIEFFSADGEATEGVRFPGYPREMCVLDSTLVVLGTHGDLDRPLHLTDLPEGAWNSIGTTDVPESDSPHRRLLIGGYLGGSIGCMEGRVVYARSSDGTVRAFNREGSVLWHVEIPSFVALVHEDVGERGIRHGPPDGATEFHGFYGVTRFGRSVVVQILQVDVRTKDVSVATVFLDVTSGQMLGRSDSLPRIVAARGNHVAVLKEEPAPEIVVYATSHQR